jgi:hypothetical protein
MKKLLIVFALISLGCTPVFAQAFTKAEVLGGYHFMQNGYGDLNFHGFLLEVEGNLTKSLGVVGEYAFNTKSIEDQRVNISSFYGGPRFSYRRENLRIFGHGLFGANYFGFETSSRTIFAMVFGGGVDIPVSDRISVRPAQLDLAIRKWTYSEGTVWGKDLRYAGGVIFKFGSQ